MNLVKTLENFEPFSDIWYDTCYYHAIFPIILHFNQKISYFLCNNIFTYSFEQEEANLMLKIKNLSGKTSETLLQDVGISLKKYISEHIVTDLVSSIDHNNPVVIGVDCFYESIRLDTYKKKHSPHDLLIYGYDLTNQTFAIIEHDFRDSFVFKKRIISFEDVENSYYGYLQYISNNHPTFYEYSFNHLSRQIAPNEYKQIFTDNLKKYEDEMFFNLDSILLFKKELYLLADRKNFSSDFPLLLSSMNDIVNKKKIQKYSLQHIFDLTDAIVKHLDDTINIWSTIRGIIAKSILMSKFNLTSLEKVATKLDSIYEAEQSFHLYLFNFIKK